MQAIPSMEVATGGSDIPTQQGEEYESQTSMEPKHISSEEGEEVDDRLHQSHGQQQVHTLYTMFKCLHPPPPPPLDIKLTV